MKSTVTLPRKPPFKSISLPELQDRLNDWGEPRYRATQVIDWVYKKRVKAAGDMTNLPASFRARLADEFDWDNLKLIRKQGSADTTQKFLFELSDGNLIESVLIPASPGWDGTTSVRRTICVSTQVGCAYGCKFCASGLDGFSRNLHAGEIVDQILGVEELSGERIQNIVFMGMGEPLANLENLLRALTVINSPWGIGIGARHITISTSGLVPQIRALASESIQVRLAISLHGATDEVREQIMPINRKYNLATLLGSCADYVAKKKQRLTFEYILIDQLNDMPAQARALAIHARKLNAKINLIPYNTVEGLPWERPPIERQEAFLQILKSNEVDATIRREKGHDIDAACGQLRRQSGREKILQSA
jgi:23S rRNA (adenine2503-C2)-methyltransferase